MLLVIFDAARADAFEPWGAPSGASPAVADLARRGSHPEHAYAAASWTVPSHASFFTGLLPRSAGLPRAPGGVPSGCRPVLERLRHRMLPEVLRTAGYSTRAVSTNAWLTPGGGFDIGFDRFELVDSERDASFSRTGRRAAARSSLEAVRARVDDGARAARGLLADWATSPSDQPFFWFVNLVESHTPFLPPLPFNPLGPIGRIKASAEARRYLTMDSIWRTNLGLLDVPKPAIDRLRALYAASILSVDSWLEGVLAKLDDEGILDDTLVIVTADHGENLGEQGRLGHSFSLDERLLRVPLVASGPVEWPGGELQSLVSLPARIAAAVGLEDHPWGPVPHDAIAVAQFDPPAQAGDPRVELARQLWGVEGRELPGLTTPLTSASDGRLKVLRRGDEWELFDLYSDPLEEDPLGDLSGTQGQILQDAILESDEHAISRQPAADADGSVTTDDEARDLERRMRLLGYM